MKKFLSVILAALLSLSLFTACKTDDDSNGNGDNGGNTPTAESSVVITLGGTQITEVALLKGEKIKIEASYSGKFDSKDTVWTSSNANVVTIEVKKSAISFQAELNAKGAGTATVTATGKKGETATLSVTVANAEINATKDVVDLFTCKTNDSFDLKTIISANGELVYENTNSNFVSIENGVVKPLKVGSAIIKAKIKNTSTYKDITVNVYDTYATPISPTIYLTVNEEINLPFNEHVSGVSYTVLNTAYATINDGKIKGLALGETLVKASLNGVESSVKVVVVSEKPTTYVANANFEESNLNFYGKNYFYKNSVAFSYGASGFEVSFYGTELKANLIRLHSYDTNHIPEVQVLVDGEKVPTNDKNARKFIVSSYSSSEFTLASGLNEGFHTVKVLKRSGFISGPRKESVFGMDSVSTDGYLIEAPTKPTLKINVIGDSITHGYGNLVSGSTPYATETNSLLTYGYLTAEKLNADVQIEGHSGWGIYIDSGGTETGNPQWYKEYGKYYQLTGNGVFNKADYDYTNFQADIIVINLGTNDSTGISKGTYTSTAFIANYKTMIEGLKSKCPNAKFVLCYGMMGTNATIMNDIKAVANSYDYATYLNFTDYRTTGGHPLVKDHVNNANELYNVINSLLNE